MHEVAKTKLAYINDLDVWEYLEGLKNFSAWVRDKARQEMQGTDDIESIVERILNAKMAGRSVAVSQIVSNDVSDLSSFL